MWHLQRVDYSYTITRGEWKARQQFHEQDAKLGLGVQHHLSGPDLIKWYYDEAKSGLKLIEIKWSNNINMF